MKTSPQGMKSIAVGNTHGKESEKSFDPERVAVAADSDPFRVGDRSTLTMGVATGYSRWQGHRLLTEALSGLPAISKQTLTNDS